jgi:hypothetical protein
MNSIYLIDHKGKFQGSFKSIRDAKNYAFHSHINNYYIKKVERKGA